MRTEPTELRPHISLGKAKTINHGKMGKGVKLGMVVLLKNDIKDH